MTKDKIVITLETALNQYHRSYQIALLNFHYQPAERTRSRSRTTLVTEPETRPQLTESLFLLMHQLCGQLVVNDFRQHEEAYDNAISNLTVLLENPEHHKHLAGTLTDPVNILELFKQDARQSLSILTRHLNNMIMHLHPLTEAEVLAMLSERQRRSA